MNPTDCNTALDSIAAFKPCCKSYGSIPTYGIMHDKDCPELRRIVLARAPLTLSEEIARAVPWALMESLADAEKLLAGRPHLSFMRGAYSHGLNRWEGNGMATPETHGAAPHKPDECAMYGGACAAMTWLEGR